LITEQERRTMPHDESRDSGASTAHVGMRYAAGLTSAFLLTTGEVIAVVYSLSGQIVGGAAVLRTPVSLVVVVAAVALGSIGTAVAGYRIISPSLRWYLPGVEPDEGQRRSAVSIARRQSAVLLAAWVVGASVLIVAHFTVARQTVAHLPVERAVVFLIIGAAAVGCTSSVSSSFLFTQRIVRPIVAAASKEFVSRETAPGIAARLVMMWVVTSALPSATIAILILGRANGWFIPSTASLDIPIVVLISVSVFLGLRALIVVARSISEPVRDVVDAMADVAAGRLGRTVDVYEQSEIGRLQNGFNGMVAGLNERERLRDLFGRHVGLDVARLALESDVLPTGDVREVAVLFIDLAGSTELAVTHTPQEVADILNDFFQIVVAAVDDHGGMINKFQGDAALAVFGAPIKTDVAATAALATARSLGEGLRRLPVVDFGIGVSAGPVFAGKIGAENRYEYTVIGDPVNEAARLADTAKTMTGRAVASGAAISRADEAERRHWTGRGSVVLRGRVEATQVSVPVDRRTDPDENGEHDDR
jgi:adenylate cyclase